MRRSIGLGLWMTLLVVSGCGSDDSTLGRGGGSPSGAGDGTYDSGAVDGAGFGSGEGSGGAGGAPPLPQSGQLTAGIWDDNVNFEHFEAYRDGGAGGEAGSDARARPSLFSTEEQDAAHANSQSEERPRAHLDVALVIDTTGSMGDEIRYLQSEFRDLATTIGDRYENAEVRWSLVVYRDHGDEYLVRDEDFTNSADAFRDSLGRQEGSGGGDYPEAPEVAFQRANQLSWRGAANTSRIAFWVADAPPHDANLSAFADSIRDMRARDVAVYPVASSGIDEHTEYLMRASAQLTGGRYIFITNDSGIGGDHKEPSIPCYYVTHLRDAILRAVDAEMTGTHTLPSDDDVIRSVGQPNASGVCELEQSSARAF